MKKLLTLAALVAVLGLFASDLAYAKLKKPSPEYMLFNSAQGREFWIAIPPNEVPNYTTNVLEVYITSAVDCQVTMEAPGIGFKKIKQVYAMQITTFSTEDGMGFFWEIRQSERVTDKGVRITADQPISVYVLNAKRYTSEGYLAIPTSAWGTEYIHCSYYDFDEVQEWAGGFIVVAKEDNTRIMINLRGRAGGQTFEGRKIGDSWSVKLYEGQTYMVRGDGKTRGLFDMTGSKIVADKPIGLISFHMRTMIPSFNIYNGRDHLSEMMPPITAWGKKYCTVEYKRDSDEGDFFRIVAAEPNTNWSMTYYDRNDGSVLGHYGGTLKNAGDFDEYLEVTAILGDDLVSIHGTSVWEADKPVLVMQYSYSEEWDGAEIFDPFMILVVPKEQYIPNTVFQTPANKSFIDNWFNIVAVGDTTDPKQEKLKSIMLDKQYVWQIDPSFIFNRIPNTELYWAKLRVEPGAHHVRGDTKFGGYIYGFSQWDSYGWPAAMAINKLDETDTVPPPVYPEGDCGDYMIRTTELVNGLPEDNPRQIDQGIGRIELLEGSYNYLLDDHDFDAWPVKYEWEFELLVEDKRIDGFARYMVTDRAGNFTIDSVSYEADSLVLDPETIDFGDQRLFTTETLTVDLINASDSTVRIESIEMKVGEFFEIVSGNDPMPIDLDPGAAHPVEIAYTPEIEALTPDMEDRDSLVVVTECLDFIWPARGRGLIPRIDVEDWDAGTIVVNNKVCKDEQLTDGLLVKNVGTMDLIITDIIDVEPPFTLSDPTDPPLPITIPPGESIHLNYCCFEPTETGTFEIDVKFVHNGDGIDSVSRWTGKAVKPGPYITSYDWQKRRVATINEGEVYLRNSAGSSTIRVTEMNLSDDADPNYRIIDVQPTLPVDLAAEDAPTGRKEITITVEFEPENEGPKTNGVVPVFDSQNVAPGSVVGNLNGIGILPKIEVIGYVFPNPIIVGDTYNPDGYVTIKSTSESADLYVERIEFDPAGDPDFSWVSTPPADFVIPMGDSVRVPVRFTARGVNERRVPVNVYNDAAPGPEVNPIVLDTAHVVGYGFDRGITIDSLDFQMVLLCDEPIGQLHITNTATVSEALVQGLNPVSGDTDNFVFITQFPQSIPAADDGNNVLPVDVQFLPDPGRTGNYSAVFELESDAGTGYALIEAVGYEVLVDITMQKWDLASQADAGWKLYPGASLPINLSISFENNNWADAAITDFTIEMVYETEYMRYIDKINKGSILQGNWTVTAVETRDGNGTSTLTIEGVGDAPIEGAGSFVAPEFQIMLSEVDDFVPEFGDITFNERDACVVPTDYPGIVEVKACVIDLRAVELMNPAELRAIDPNPVSTPEVEIKYNVSHQDLVKLEIYNSNGQLVKTVENSVMNEGLKSSYVSVQDLPSGAYQVVLTVGPYVKNRSMVISK